MTNILTRSVLLSTLHRHFGPRRHHRGRIALLVLLDLLVILASTALALLSRDRITLFKPTLDLTENVLPVAGFLVVLWLACLWATGAYQWKKIGAGSGEYTAVLTGSLLAAGIAGVAAYLTGYDLSRGFYVLVFAIGIVLVLLERLIFRRLVHALRTSGQLTTTVLLVGDEAHVDELARVLRREPWLGYDVVGVLVGGALPDQEVTAGGLPVLGDSSTVAEAVHQTDVELIIFTEGAFPKAHGFNRLARDLEEHDTQMVVVPALTDVSAARMNMRPVAGLPLVFVETPGAARANRWAKRAFDIVGSAFALVVAAPVMAVVALLIKAEDAGPVLYRQVRIGRKGTPFACLKFRSMVVDADARLAELQSRRSGPGVLFKMKDDPRITRIGRFTRRFSLDELPQLFNVLVGQMSLVGPRPALPAEVERYEQHVHRRLDVRPGLTGLWQVSGRSDLSWEDTVRLDLYYVDNWSLMQDLMILGRTVGAVLSSRGAY